MTDKDPRPYIVLTVVLDAGARAAAITRAHGDALERAMKATADKAVAGLELVELPIGSGAFSVLRKHLGAEPGTVGLYDLFPLASHLPVPLRKIAGQRLAAEALWTLEEQGLLGGIHLNIRLDLPKGWENDLKVVDERLREAGALDLTAEGVETFKAAKSDFDRAQTQLSV